MARPLSCGERARTRGITDCPPTSSLVDCTATTRTYMCHSGTAAQISPSISQGECGKYPIREFYSVLKNKEIVNLKIKNKKRIAHF